MIEIFYLDKTVKKASLADLPKLRRKKIWIDITGITKDESIVIKSFFGLHPLTAEDLITPNARIKVEEFDDYLFCVFYGIKKSKIELIEIDFVVGKNFVISNHSKPIKSIEELKGDYEKVGNLLSKGVDFVFHRILDMEIDNFMPSLESIDDEIEDIEEKVTEKPSPELLSRILGLKRKMVMLKKVVFPQREKVSFLTKNDYRFISENAKPYFRDVYDHAIRVHDTVENYREAIGNTFDVYMSSVSNSMNEVMKVLSIIATIALPLTVISGIYGTNFSVLPGQGFAYGFWIMILAMVLLCVFMLFYFRKKRWI